jgi:hypothetical protein
MSRPLSRQSLETMLLLWAKAIGEELKAFLLDTHPSATTKPKESIMTKAQLKEIRQIMACEYRIAIACKRTFSPVWYLFV